MIIAPYQNATMYGLETTVIHTMSLSSVWFWRGDAYYLIPVHEGMISGECLGEIRNQNNSQLTIDRQ